MLDSSTSVGEASFQKLLRFVANLVQETPVDTGHFRVGVMTYNSEVTVNFHLDKFVNNEEAMLEAILNIPYTYGQTNTADGLKVGTFKIGHGLYH